MAGLKNADHFSDGEQLNSSKVGMVRFLSLVIGAGALGLFVLLYLIIGGKEVSVDGHGLHSDHLGNATIGHSMAYSWLFAVMFFLSLTVGGIFWTLLHNATNSGWGTGVRRLMETLGSVVPFMIVLALPLVAFPSLRGALWEWTTLSSSISESGKKFAEEELPGRQKILETEKATAKSEFASLEGELTKGLAKADADGNAGDKYHLEAKLEAEKQRLDLVLEKEVTKKDLKSEHLKHENYLLYKKKGFLNLPFWSFRYVFYIAGLSVIIFFLRKWSTTADKDGDPKWFRRMRRASCGFLPLFAVCWTFLVFDWLMGLDYTWFSTMWGVYLFAGCALNSMALLIILLTYLRKTGHLTNVITVEHYHIMGKLMLAFTIFWAYIAFSQFFLIWYANITEETKFYLERNTEFWNPYTIAFLVIGHFFIPFAALLLQKIKKIPMALCGVALWNLCMHFFDLYWIIIPERGPSLSGGEAMMIPNALWLDLLAFIAVGGLFVFFLLRNLGQHSLFPSRDPRLDESLNLVN